MKALAGTGALVRLILRRDRFILPLWVILLALIVISIPGTLADLFPSAAERRAYLDVISANPALGAVYGPAFGSSLGALTAWRLGGTVIFVGLATLLTVVRHTRAEEEAGRRELLGSTAVGRQAPLFAALLVAFGASLALGILTALGLAAYGLPVAGSVAFGLSWVAFGCLFAAVAAVAAQLTEGARAARGLALAVFGVCLLLRVAGDAGKTDWLSWASPLGWVPRVRPFAGEQWWVFALFSGAILVLAVAALALSARRDLGAGFLPARPGRATASPSLRGPFGLTWRLQRGSLLAWVLGFAVFGGVFGGVTRTATQVAGASPRIRAVVESLGGSSGLVDAWFSTLVGLLGIVAAGYAVGAALRMRGEEADGRIEPMLAAAVSRSRWAASHLVFAVFGPALLMAVAGLAAGLAYGLSTEDVGHDLPRVLGAALAQLPAVWVLAGVAVAFFGVLPRLAAPVGWTALVACVLLQVFGRPLQLSDRVLDLSPFEHLPRLPGGEVSAAPLVWLVAIAAALVAAGLVAFRRRDVP
ncbi:Multidrug efflux system permease protein [Rubrobacter xylanophilus DSM 9941]|uniref:ABC transporter permease n=1 Tax=Rubrobacter xylanophilus TaxID=49319 RepID=UPI001C63D5C4|nr:hypothetical protein [Rubrobacter xylanophilus]QYJ17247.1 Multidrug efflux system permease protein [Rubrobacter xylanophilus DSM 9941]